MNPLRLIRLVPGAGLLNPFRWFVRIVALIVVGYVALCFFVVWSASTGDSDPGTRAEAIVVLGAAQYNGTPSPVLRARLDRALELYRAKLAPLVVVTGGRQVGDRMTEAASSARYLSRHGVPDSAIRREVQGTNTYESMRATVRFLGERNVIVVTSGFHMARASATAREVGLRPSAAPADHHLPADRWIKESLVLGVANLTGYRRLSAWFA